MENRKFETQKGSEFKTSEGVLTSAKVFPRAVWTLISNLPFMFMNMTVVVQFFLVAGLAVFGPKYLESQLSMTSSESALAMGFISVTGGMLGALFGGILVNRLDLKFRGLMKTGAVCAALSLLACFVFLTVCPTLHFAGVTVDYKNKTLPLEEPSVLNATCNSHCACSGSYAPVCGSDGVMYYSACHAGCVTGNPHNDDGVYIECRCIYDTTTVSGFGTAAPGTCGTSCPYRWPYFVALFFIVFLGTTTGVCTWTGTIRIVSHSQRAFALGLQTVIYALLGSIPGPIVFGALLDNSCLLWETTCEGTSTCWLYDNQGSANGFLILSAGAEFLAIFFFALAYVSYRAPQESGKCKTEDVSAALDM